MASLLSLPVELLDDIIDLVVLDARLPPENLMAARQNRWKDEELPSEGAPGSLSWSFGPEGVRYEHETTANATGLLLTNHQLYQQTIDAVARLYPGGVSYHMDVILVNERWLVPTWLHIPVISKRLAYVQVNVRIFDLTERPFGMVRNDGGHPGLVWPLWHLLQSFLLHGLAHPPPRPSTRRQYPGNRHPVIDTISLDFCMGARIPELVETPKGYWNPLYNIAMDQTALANFVQHQLSSALHLGSYDSAHGCLLFERVGEMVLSVDGSQRELLTLGAELAARAFSPGPPAPGKSSLWTLYTFGHIDGDCRVMSAWNWKCRAVQTRRRLGFEMPTPIKWPTLNLWLEWKEVHEEWKEAQDSVDEPGKRCACLETELEAMLMSRLSRPRH